MNKEVFMNKIKQRIEIQHSKQEHLDRIEYLKMYDEYKEIKKLNKELKKNIILNEEI